MPLAFGSANSPSRSTSSCPDWPDVVATQGCRRWHRDRSRKAPSASARRTAHRRDGGIGRAFSRKLASRGASVLVVGQTFRDGGVSGIEFVKADLSLIGSKLLLKVMEWMTSFMTIKPEKYAERLTPLLVSPDVEGRSGSMFNNQGEAILPLTKMTEDYISAFLGGSRALVSQVELRHQSNG